MKYCVLLLAFLPLSICANAHAQDDARKSDGVARDGKVMTTDGKTKRADAAKVDRLVKAPDTFYSADGERLFSGPQPGESLPPMKIVSFGGELDGKELDLVAMSKGRPMLMVLMDDSDLGGKSSYFIGQLAKALEANTDRSLATSIVYLGDDPDEIEKQIAAQHKYLPEGLILGYSPEGRDGPGTYGLNRNVPVTMIVANKGRVLHNFAFGQHVFELDPHVAGAVAEVIGADRKTLAGWLSQGDKSGSMMKKESIVIAWAAWAKKASVDEVQKSLESDKFRELKKKDQAAIRKAIKAMNKMAEK